MNAALSVLKAGVGCSLQSTQRTGHRDIGICSAGPQDCWSAQRANLLVANDTLASCLEIPCGIVELLCNKHCLVSLVGYGFLLRVNNINHRLNQAFKLKAGDTIRIDNTQATGVAYLAINGGFLADDFLGSQSTDISIARGGYQGRYIKPDDILSQAEEAPIATQLIGKGIRPESLRHDVRAIPGPDSHTINHELEERFWGERWCIQRSRNRMGVRLSCNAKDENQPSLPSLRSSAVLPGTIQMTSSNQCIALMADCQTTGGYARVATIFRADLWQLAQLPIESKIRFIKSDANTARKALFKKHQELNRLAFESQRLAALS